MLLEENFLKKALEHAHQAEKNGEVPIGAIIVKDNKIVGTASNTREAEQDPLGHAECIVIRKVAQEVGAWRLENCDLYVTLEPCVMCLAACQQARIRKVFYGAKDPKGGAISLGYEFNKDKKLNHLFETEYVSIPECETILSEFFKKKRKEKKSV